MPFNNQPPTALLGLGNLLMEDEGIGVHVLRRLETEYHLEPEPYCVDGGTAGFELLPIFQDYDRILMIDAVEFKREPGTIDILRDDQILTELTQKMSLHHLGITDVLSSARLLEYNPSEIVLLGIQPYCIDNIQMELSMEMQDRMDAIVKVALDLLNTWGIKSRPK